MPPFSWAQAALLILASVAAVSDSRHGTIPNWLTLPVLLLAPFTAGFLHGPRACAAAVLGLLVCGGVPYLFFRAGAMGGGDVKLFAAIGACAGPREGMEIQLVAIGLLLVVAILRLAWQGGLWRMLASSFRIAIQLLMPRRKRGPATTEQMLQMRLGVPIWVATAWILGQRLLRAWVLA